MVRVPTVTPRISRSPVDMGHKFGRFGYLSYSRSLFIDGWFYSDDPTVDDSDVSIQDGREALAWLRATEIEKQMRESIGLVCS